MIQPNFELFLWILLIIIAIKAILNIVLGLLEVERSERYGIGDIIDGFIWLIIIIVVILT